ncbi:MAG: zinc ribbon domain-containing protein [Ruminiclostridium sp.]|nr:zinc ribbon domain-containing protein [Ruminiclostridium sp.]
MFCGDCGEIYGSKVWHSTNKYRLVIWQCNGKFKGEHKFETPHLYEKLLKTFFVAAMSEYLSGYEDAIADLQYAQRSLTDTDFIDEDMRALGHELEITYGMIRVCINSNASNTMSEEEYRAKHSELCKRFKDTEEKYNSLKRKREHQDALCF